MRMPVVVDIDAAERSACYDDYTVEPDGQDAVIIKRGELEVERIRGARQVYLLAARLLAALRD